MTRSVASSILLKSSNVCSGYDCQGRALGAIPPAGQRPQRDPETHQYHQATSLTPVKHAWPDAFNPVQIAGKPLSD